MSMPQSEETHQSLLAKIPEATGRDLPSWLASLEQGPTLLRLEERVGLVEIALLEDAGIRLEHRRSEHSADEVADLATEDRGNGDEDQ